MEFKRLLIVLSVTITLTICLMFGVTYGWYEYSNATVDVNGSTMKEVPTVIFTSNDSIFMSKIMPIYYEDRYNYGEKNTFTITIGENLKDYEVGIEISLKDIKMSNELKISDYRYELLQDGIVVGSGDFSDIGMATVMNLMPIVIMKPDVYPKTYTYELYIWLNETDDNQNYLMNKIFNARLNVNSAIKK